VTVDARGGLVLGVEGGEVRLGKPRIYQEIDGSRCEISGGYSFKNKQEVSFEIAAYDTSRPLVIDPTLSYSTYLGGDSYGIAVDAAGNAYVTGSASNDGFVTKLNPTGSAPLVLLP